MAKFKCVELDSNDRKQSLKRETKNVVRRKQAFCLQSASTSTYSHQNVNI